jgi:hypothetical protein
VEDPSSSQHCQKLFDKDGSESDISEPVFFKAGLAVNKEVYISKCLPVLDKFTQNTTKTMRRTKN